MPSREPVCGTCGAFSPDELGPDTWCQTCKPPPAAPVGRCTYCGSRPDEPHSARCSVTRHCTPAIYEVDEADLRAERDFHIRLFNRLEKAVSDHKASLPEDEWFLPDEKLYAAHKAIMRDAAKGPHLAPREARTAGGSVSAHLSRSTEQELIAAFAIPPAFVAQPVNDGTWTTSYADKLDALGLHHEAREERLRALGPRTAYVGLIRAKP